MTYFVVENFSTTHIEIERDTGGVVEKFFW